MQSLAQKVLLEYLEGHGKEEIERSSQTIKKF
jgi:histone acetyltransferase (RNA polymerase elongator complex component)